MCSLAVKMASLHMSIRYASEHGPVTATTVHRLPGMVLSHNFCTVRTSTQHARSSSESSMSISLVVIANQLGPVPATTVDISSGMVLRHNFAMAMDSTTQSLSQSEIPVFLALLTLATSSVRYGPQLQLGLAMDS